MSATEEAMVETMVDEFAEPVPDCCSKCRLEVDEMSNFGGGVWLCDPCYEDTASLLDWLEAMEVGR